MLKFGQSPGDMGTIKRVKQMALLSLPTWKWVAMTASFLLSSDRLAENCWEWVEHSFPSSPWPGIGVKSIWGKDVWVLAQNCSHEDFRATRIIRNTRNNAALQCWFDIDIYIPNHWSSPCLENSVLVHLAKQPLTYTIVLKPGVALSSETL